MKQIIIYKSKTGFTKRYAQWLGEALKCPYISLEEAKKASLSDYDVIVFGSSFKAGAIEDIQWYREKVLPEQKENVVFVTGAYPPAATDIAKALDQNFSREEQKTIRVFYLQGGLNYEAMSFGDKLMMRVFRSMLKSKKGKTEEEKQLLELCQKSFDNTDPANMEPMLNYLMGL